MARTGGMMQCTGKFLHSESILKYPIFAFMKWKQFRDSGYQVSEFGGVKNKHNKILKAVEPKLYKYRSYVLKINGRAVNLFEHRMVAECFVDNREGKKEVNHVDGNKINNHFSNLQWVTRSENNQHAYDTGLKTYRPLHYKGKFGKEHNRSKSVVCTNGKTYGSMSEAARELNIDISSVSWSVKYKKPIYGMNFEISI